MNARKNPQKWPEKRRFFCEDVEIPAENAVFGALPGLAWSKIRTNGCLSPRLVCDSCSQIAARTAFAPRALFGSELLFGQFCAEFLLLLRYEFLVAARINERILGSILQARIFFFHLKVTTVGTEENVARQ